MASKHETLTSLFTDVADAIREKNKTTDLIVADEFPNAIRDITTGVDINGVIEKYKVVAGENISAGDFVSYLIGDEEVGTDTTLVYGQTARLSISAVALDESRVFITHTVNDSNNRLFGMVCTIDGTTITAGTDTTLSSTKATGKYTKVVRLSDDKVFIAHSNNVDYTHLYGMVCTIDGTTITAGTDTSIVTSQYAGLCHSVAVLSENKVFIAYTQGSNYVLNAVVCTVNGTAITVGAKTSLSASPNTGSYISAVALDESRVFITHSFSSYYYLYGMVCTINGTTITAGTDTELYSTSYSSLYICSVFLDKSRVFIAYNSDSSNYYLMGMVCTISNTTITKGSSKALLTSQSGKQINAMLLTDNKVFIAHGNNNTVSYTTCTIDETDMVVGVDVVAIAGTGIDNIIAATITNDKKIFIAHPSNVTDYRLNGVVVSYKTGITSLSDNIFGIAKTDANGGGVIEVYVPN